MIKWSFIFLLSALFNPSFCFATAWKIQANDQNKVSFEAVGNPGFLRINGEGGKAAGVLTDAGGKINGEITVTTGDFKTGIPARDEHMKAKYLGSGAAKLVLDPVLPNATGFDFTGQLTIKSDTVPIKGHGKVSTVAAGQVFSGGFELNLEDFKSIGVPTYMGVTVAKKVTVAIEFLVSDK